jgi:ELWxxDGT repeat protein
MRTSTLLTPLFLFSALATSVPAQYLVRDINPGAASSSPAFFKKAGNTVFFRADDGVNGNELWKTDGTAAGTVMVADIRPGPSGSDPVQPQMLAFGDALYFNADDGTNGIELWKSDGTAGGTVMVADVSPGPVGSNPQWLTVVGNTLFFVAYTPATDYELWKSDGTTAGTVLVSDIVPGAVGSGAQNLVAVGNTLFFMANDGSTGYELWKSDGTAGGTVLVSDINPGSTGSYPSSMTAFGNTLYFAANDGVNGNELWQSDGTPAGTFLFVDIRVGASSSDPENLRAAGGLLFFGANNGINGNELWKSDGTPAGTVMAADIRPGFQGSDPHSLTWVAPALFLTAHNGTFGGNGRELWVSLPPYDSTTTSLVFDIYAGSASGLQAGQNRLFAPADNLRVLMAAENGASGFELWKSDGTAAGTVMLADIAAGVGDSSPAGFTRSGDLVFFQANDAVNGLELWAVPLGAFGGALAEPFGSGCPGTGNLVPEISGVGLPVIGNGSFGVRVSQALPFAPVALIIDAAQGQFPLGGGCTFYLGQPLVIVPFGTDGTGQATLPAGIPNIAALVGGNIFCQWVVLDPAGAYQGLASFTGGLRIVIGD